MGSNYRQIDITLLIINLINDRTCSYELWQIAINFHSDISNLTDVHDMIIKVALNSYRVFTYHFKNAIYSNLRIKQTIVKW